MSLFKYGEFEKELDFTDPDFLDTIDTANKRMKKRTEQLSPTGSKIELAREQVNIIDDFFDDVLGDGASKKMFSSNSAMKRVEAMNTMKTVQMADEMTVAEMRSQFEVFQHTHAGNRQQRRAYNKNHKRR